MAMSSCSITSALAYPKELTASCTSTISPNIGGAIPRLASPSNSVNSLGTPKPCYRSTVVSARRRLLVEGLSLPADLAADFRTARDLFSVGLDEVGGLIAGRGLKGVLRAITR